MVGEIFGSFSADDNFGDKNIAIDVLDFSSSFPSGAFKVYPSFIDYVLQKIDEIGRLTEVLKIRIRRNTQRSELSVRENKSASFLVSLVAKVSK